MNQNISIEFKIYLKENQYDKCCKIIRNILIEYIVNKINKNIDGIKYTYTNMSDLIKVSTKYIKDEDKYIAGKIENYAYDETYIEELERLLIICRTYGINNLKLDGLINE